MVGRMMGKDENSMESHASIDSWTEHHSAVRRSLQRHRSFSIRCGFGFRHLKVEMIMAPTNPDASNLLSSGNTIKSCPILIFTANSKAESEIFSGTQGRPPWVF